ncbi:MAG TPA: hypothetical protein VH912_00705 [Streptosporangiaceae bacterium]|jgi:hypothetical protein
MQCPNCYADTSPALPRCTRCNAPLPQWQQRQPPGQLPGAYDRPWEPAAGWQTEHGPVSPEPEQWGTPPPQRDLRPLIVTLIIAIVIGGGVAAGVILWPHKAPDTATSGVPPPGSSAAVSPAESGSPVAGAHDQATTVDGLLDEMAASRTDLGSAMTDAASCDTVGDAVAALDRIKGERQEQLDKAQRLPVDAIAGGDDMRDALSRAARFSLQADEQFLAWAEANQGCTAGATPHDGHFDSGQDISTDQASPAKQEFVRLWNPIAEQEGLSTRSADKF